MTTKYANIDLVAVAWLKSLLNQTGDIGTELPGPETWTDTTFVQVTTPVGGSSDIYTPQRHPVIGVKCWAKPATTSKRPPWRPANNLAEAIRAGCLGHYQTPLAVALGAGYPSVLVHCAYPLSDPKRLGGDDSSYACFQLDVQLHWTATARPL